MPVRHKCDSKPRKTRSCGRNAPSQMLQQHNHKHPHIKHTDAVCKGISHFAKSVSYAVGNVGRRVRPCCKSRDHAVTSHITHAKRQCKSWSAERGVVLIRGPDRGLLSEISSRGFRGFCGSCHLNLVVSSKYWTSSHFKRGLFQNFIPWFSWCSWLSCFHCLPKQPPSNTPKRESLVVSV